MIFLLSSLVALGLACAAPAAAPAQTNTPQQCQTQTINVDSQWTMDPTAIATDQFCDITFVIPSDSYAIVEVNANNVGYYDNIYIGDKIGDHMGKMTRENTWSSSLAWPGTVTVNIQTQNPTSLVLAIKVTVKKSTPQANVVQRVTTSTNSASTVLYLSDWVEGSSYVFTSQGSTINLKTADNTQSANEETLFTNVFVYDGDQVVGTLWQVYQRQDFVSKTNKVTLYMPKKTTFRAAVLVTDQSNVNSLEAHYVTYAPTEMPDGIQTHLISGGTAKEGAVTIIGDKDGSTPIDVLAVTNLDDLNGSFSVASGGPQVAHPQATVLTNGALPKHLTSNVNTFYLSRGSGTVKYSTPKK